MPIEPKKRKTRNAFLYVITIIAVIVANIVISILANYSLFKFISLFNYNTDLTLSMSITILEVYIVVFSLGLVILGVWGYNSIKEDTRKSVEKSVKNEIEVRVSEQVEEKMKQYNGELESISQRFKDAIKIIEELRTQLDKLAQTQQSLEKLSKSEEI